MLLKKRFLSSPWSFARPWSSTTRESDSGSGLEIDDEDEYYQEVLGSGQSDEEEGDADQPEFTALRQSKGSDPLVAATAAGHRVPDRLGPAATSTSPTPG